MLVQEQHAKCGKQRLAKALVLPHTSLRIVGKLLLRASGCYYMAASYETRLCRLRARIEDEPCHRLRDKGIIG